MLTLSDFDYDLPEHLIATHPLPRGTSRLLHLTPPDYAEDLYVNQLPSLLQQGDLIITNNTQVIRARLYIQRHTGGKGEILIERITDQHTGFGQFKVSNKPKPGEHIFILGTSVALEIIEIKDRWITFKSTSISIHEIMELYGNIPLPPYLNRPADHHDDETYQTVFAQIPGAVAAPTAGLHFTNAMLSSLKNKGIQHANVTLHVGSGTLLPVKDEHLDNHIMHQEWFDIPKETVNLIEFTQARNGRIVAIGTTTLRALESAAQSGTIQEGSAETRLFIRPGYSFNVVDCLFTNFHLPKSTLLMLVSAFGGTEFIRNAYLHAIEKSYRFFSYGDAMFIHKK